MSSVDNAVRSYIESIRAGDFETGFFGLLDIPDALALLIDEANRPENRAIRAALTKIIWEYRRPEAIDFLGNALGDPDPNVWKEALDGLVTIDGPESAHCIMAALARVKDGSIQNGLSVEWLVEALEQMGDAS
jgi:hypothetical protein